MPSTLKNTQCGTRVLRTEGLAEGGSRSEGGGDRSKHKTAARGPPKRARERDGRGFGVVQEGVAVLSVGGDVVGVVGLEGD
jgi:hypothetical protein